MFRSFHTQLVTKIASATILLAVTFAGGLVAISMAGVSEVKAEPETTNNKRRRSRTGYASPYFVTNAEKMRAEMDDRMS
jgi:hypothetical protein